MGKNTQLWLLNLSFKRHKNDKKHIYHMWYLFIYFINFFLYHWLKEKGRRQITNPPPRRVDFCEGGGGNKHRRPCDEIFSKGGGAAIVAAVPAAKCKNWVGKILLWGGKLSCQKGAGA